MDLEAYLELKDEWINERMTEQLNVIGCLLLSLEVHPSPELVQVSINDPCVMMRRCESGILFFQVCWKPEVFASCSFLHALLLENKNDACENECQNTAGKLPVIQNFPSGLHYSSKGKTRKTPHGFRLRIYMIPLCCKFFSGKISVPYMPGASATKQTPRCFGDVFPWNLMEWQIQLARSWGGHWSTAWGAGGYPYAMELDFFQWMGTWLYGFDYCCFTVLRQLCWLTF